jgi:hypothetical protein
MVAGADSIEDMDLVRHGGMGKLFTGSRAPTTLGTQASAPSHKRRCNSFRCGRITW